MLKALQKALFWRNLTCHQCREFQILLQTPLWHFIMFCILCELPNFLRVPHYLEDLKEMHAIGTSMWKSRWMRGTPLKAWLRHIICLMKSCWPLTKVLEPCLMQSVRQSRTCCDCLHFTQITLKINPAQLQFSCIACLLSTHGQRCSEYLMQNDTTEFSSLKGHGVIVLGVLCVGWMPWS